MHIYIHMYIRMYTSGPPARIGPYVHRHSAVHRSSAACRSHYPSVSEEAGWLIGASPFRQRTRIHTHSQHPDSPGRLKICPGVGFWLCETRSSYLHTEAVPRASLEVVALKSGLCCTPRDSQGAGYGLAGSHHDFPHRRFPTPCGSSAVLQEESRGDLHHDHHA